MLWSALGGIVAVGAAIGLNGLSPWAPLGWYLVPVAAIVSRSRATRTTAPDHYCDPSIAAAKASAAISARRPSSASCASTPCRPGVTGRYSSHSMRATFITHALENGASLEEVQRAAGHANVDTTKLYDRRGYSPEKSAAFFRDVSPMTPVSVSPGPRWASLFRSKGGHEAPGGSPMIVTVRYRIDAHEYRGGSCGPGCTACALECRRWGSQFAAEAAQPKGERDLPGGHPDALIPSPRRFEVVVLDHFASL